MEYYMLQLQGMLIYQKEIVMEDTCVSCNDRPIAVKKWKLCSRCYMKQRNAHVINTKPKVLGQFRELRFASRYLKSGWIHHPMLLRFADGSVYTPDFWDPERKSFIELVGTKQAFFANKEKYEKLRACFPTIPLVCVTETNKEIPYPNWTKDVNLLIE